VPRGTLETGGMRVCVAVYEYRNGSQTRAFDSEEAALEWRTSIAKWNREAQFPWHFVWFLYSTQQYNINLLL